MQILCQRKKVYHRLQVTNYQIVSHPQLRLHRLTRQCWSSTIRLKEKVQTTLYYLKTIVSPYRQVPVCLHVCFSCILSFKFAWETRKKNYFIRFYCVFRHHYIAGHRTRQNQIENEPIYDDTNPSIKKRVTRSTSSRHKSSNSTKSSTSSCHTPLLVNIHSSQKHSPDKSSEVEPPQKKNREQRPDFSLRFNGKNHLPAKENYDHATRCKLEGCKMKTHVYCTKCNVHLCLEPERNCYLKFHQNNITE